MPDTRYIIDTSALIELYLESEKGEKVLAKIKNAATLVPSIVVAELKRKLEREGLDSSSFIHGIKETSLVLDLTFEIANAAGKKHSELRKKFPNISLADCIVMAHSEQENVKVITTDGHFKETSAVVI